MPGNGLEKSSPLTQRLPTYTEVARKSRIEGTPVLKVFIRKDGTAGNIKVLKGLGYGLDESAIHTISQKWRFSPETLYAEPIEAGLLYRKVDSARSLGRVIPIPHPESKQRTRVVPITLKHLQIRVSSMKPKANELSGYSPGPSRYFKDLQRAITGLLARIL